SDVAYSPDGKFLPTAGADCTKIWDAATGRELHSLSYGTSTIAFGLDGHRLATGLKLWDTYTGSELMSPISDPKKAPVRGILCSAYSSDLRWLAVAFQDGRGSRIEISEVLT